MIDNFALGLTHALMILAAWRLLRRDDLDCEDGAVRPTWRQRRSRAGTDAGSGAAPRA